MNKLNLNCLLFLSLFLTFFGCSNAVQMVKHIGEWKNSSENTGLILDESNHAYFVINNQVNGGDEFKNNGVKGELKYEIDYSKNPIWLDIILITQGKDGQIYEKRLKGIVKFLTDRKMEYNVLINGDIRPNGFDKGEIQILNKQN